MERGTVFIFGEAERGPYCAPLSCNSIIELFDQMGNAPADTEGLSCAVQTLLFQRDLIYFRVEEEGFGFQDYFKGFELLRNKRSQFALQAIGMPGVGDAALIEAAIPICRLHQSILLLTEKDLYDYLTGVVK